MRHQHADGAGGNAANGAAEFQRGLLHKASREHGDVLAAVAEGGKRYGKFGEAVVEVGAEAGGGDARLELLVGGGNQADIERRGVDAAERAQLALLDDAEQFDLGGKREVSHLVEEEGAALGSLEIAGLLAIGAGESASMVAEELGF